MLDNLLRNIHSNFSDSCSFYSYSLFDEVVPRRFYLYLKDKKINFEVIV